MLSSCLYFDQLLLLILISQADELTATCSGHDAADLLPMEIEGRTMSNLEFWQYMNPLNGSLPYVYDNFRWAHCDEEGFGFYNYGR